MVTVTDNGFVLVATAAVVAWAVVSWAGGWAVSVLFYRWLAWQERRQRGARGGSRR